MNLYIVHYYNDTAYEESLEINAVCTSEKNADEICKKLNELYSYRNYNYVEIKSDIEFNDVILRY